MAKQLRKQQARLASRQVNSPTRDAYRKPGSMNPRKGTGERAKHPRNIRQASQQAVPHMKGGS